MKKIKLTLPYAYETKEGELAYGETGRVEYNRTYNNNLGVVDGLWDYEQVVEMLRQAGVEVHEDE